MSLCIIYYLEKMMIEIANKVSECSGQNMVDQNKILPPPPQTSFAVKIKSQPPNYSFTLPNTNNEES